MDAHPRTRVLLFCPTPPPITGQSYASLDALNHFRTLNYLEVLHVNSGGISRSMWAKLTRALKQAAKYYKHGLGCDIIYHQIAQSRLGFLKDTVLILPTLLFARQTRIVFHCHGGGGLYFQRTTGSPIDTLLTTIAKYIYARIAALILLDPLSDESWLKITDAKKIHYLENFWRPRSKGVTEETIRARLSLQYFDILYMSNLHPSKGIFELLEAFRKVKASHPFVRLFVAGAHVSSEEKTAFEQATKGQKDVFYLGTIDEDAKAPLLENVRLFCLPTYYPSEGQPISIIEAYSWGIPVLTTAHNGIPHIFANEVNGLLVEKRSPDSLAEKIHLIVTDTNLQEQFSMTNLQIANHRFSLANHLRKLQRIVLSEA
jgi:glycosyltransferase involved in cell wall biosynthesis